MASYELQSLGGKLNTLHSIALANALDYELAARFNGPITNVSVRHGEDTLVIYTDRELTGEERMQVAPPMNVGIQYVIGPENRHPRPNLT